MVKGPRASLEHIGFHAQAHDLHELLRITAYSMIHVRLWAKRLGSGCLFHSQLWQRLREEQASMVTTATAQQAAERVRCHSEVSLILLVGYSTLT